MATLSIGKLRGLQQCATERGALAVFALDHRHNLRRALGPDAPEAVSPEEMSTFKRALVTPLAPAASAGLSAASAAPWVLLSASVDYETYLRQVENVVEDTMERVGNRLRDILN